MLKRIKNLFKKKATYETPTEVFERKELSHKDQVQRFADAYSDLKALKNSIDDILFVLQDHEAEYLPEQFQLFAEKYDFALTSTIQTVGTAFQKRRAEYIAKRVKDAKKQNA